MALTWLPVYGVEEHSDLSSEAKEAMSSTEGLPKDSLFLEHDGTRQTQGTAVKSEEMTLVEQLTARGKELDERDQALTAEAQRLETLRKDLEALAKEHAQAIGEAVKFREAKKVEEKVDPTQQSLAHLIKVYDAMDSEDAAIRLEKMKEPLALDILAGIKEKKAASMLAGVEPGKAARLSEGLRNYGKKKKAAKP